MASDLGFTLIELLVVLMILSMLYAILPRYIGARDNALQLSRASEQLVADLKGLRQWSILSGSPAEFKMDAEHHAYALNTNKEKRRVLKDDYQLSFENLTAEDISAQPRIAFFPDGRNSGGEIKIKADGRVKLVSADPFSGSLTVREPSP
jgi:type II secretion system protein H